jgi:methyl-accepting chemotaxis protein
MMAKKTTLSTKWKMTVGVLGVLVPVIGAFYFVQNRIVTRCDSELFQALTSRSKSNVTNFSGEVTFEMAANLRDEVEKKLRRFVTDHPETDSIIVLDDQKNIYATVGAKVDVTSLINRFRSMEKGTAITIGDLVVAVAPILSEEQKKRPLGYLLYTESKREYYAFRSTNAFWQAVVILAGFGFILTGIYFLVSRMTAPMYELAKAAERIADGDLSSVEVDVNGSGISEYERLAAAMSRTAVALQHQVVGIKGLTKNMGDMFKEMVVAVTSLASSASQQASAVTETATTVEEIEQTSKAASGNAGRIVEVAKKTQEASIRGRDAVKISNDIISRIRDDSKDISDKSAKLLTEIEEVESVIESVKAIAEQSKILAVNASIEAAKAGEFGSGFAVVAQEVKDLAQQSKDATIKITSTLSTIRGAIEDMVETSDSGKKRTEEGVSMISNVGAIMYDLSEAIRENSEFANVISTSIKQQTVGLSQISAAMEEINAAATDNRTISRTIEERVGNMSKEVDELEALVGKWRTPS